MSYYKVLMDDTTNNDIVCHYESDYGIDYSVLCRGKEFGNWNSDFTFYYDKSEGEIATDYLANDKGWFVVSERLRELMDQMKVNCQYIRIPIIEVTTKEPLPPHYAANILQTVDAICLEESEYTTINTTKSNKIFYSISKYAVYESKLQGIDVFKLANGHEIPIFVSQRFKDETKIRKLTGMEFREIRTVE